MHPHSGLDDHEMSDASDLPCTCDSDVAGLAGPGGTSNNDSVNIDVDVSNPSCNVVSLRKSQIPCICDSDVAGPGATLNNDFMY